MKVIYALEEMPDIINKSLFLMGPTPRSNDDVSWRIEALKLLDQKNFDGVVFIPETRNGEWKHDYDDQIEWEDECLNVADVIVAWVPRNLKTTMKGLSTNIEFGFWRNSGKLVLGFPSEAEKMSYIAHYAKQEKIPTASTLSETLDLALSFIEKEAPRSGGDRYVPLYIWNTPQFQSWYEAQSAAGNYLNSAKVLFTYHHIKRQFGLFLFILRANVYVAAESRIKAFDFLLARTDVSSVLLWYRHETLEDSEVVLVREFRPSVSNKNCYIVELPSGSTADPKESEPLHVAVEEVWEETGFAIEPDRLKFHMARQLIAPLSSHKSYLFSAELTEEELDWFKSQKDLVHGNINSGERTFIEVRKIKDLFENDDLDWSTLGQILSVIK